MTQLYGEVPLGLDGTHVAKDGRLAERGRGPSTRRSSDRSRGLDLRQVLTGLPSGGCTQPWARLSWGSDAAEEGRLVTPDPF